MRSFAFISVLLYSINLNAQTYIGFAGTYNLPQPNMIWAKSFTDTSTIAMKSSLGKGFSPLMYFGYSFNENLGAEISFGYLFGNKMSAGYRSDTNSFTMSFYARRISVNPSMIFKEKIIKNKLFLKGTLGALFSPKTTIYRSFTMSSSTSNLEQIWKLKTKINLGFFGAIGLHYKIKHKVSFDVEIIGNSSTVYLKSGKYTKYSYNNFDMLTTMPADKREWNYLNEISTSSNPNDQLIESYLMNSVGLRIGLQYLLGK
jgi:hypothetical protein